MTRDDDDRLETLFQEALELDTAERTLLLDRVGADDPALRAEVEALLSADAVAARFLDSPLSGEAGPPEDATGRQVGRYRIVRALGTGGMGTVYEAVQDQPQRRVALKVLHAGLATPAVMRRFTREAEVLGRLRHPGVGQVYESGTDDRHLEPVPYIAMEFVPGALSITAYAETRGLTIEQRLGLFIGVCDAVQHAHQRGIIHRDLKPRNILVDDQGRPKVIDFGVARTVDPDLSRITQHTEAGRIVGTLRYMSPEQCDTRTDEIDTRTDVYALGVVLFELTTGRLPYDFSSTSPYEIPRLIRESPPVHPSTIARSLRGDLETIVLKTLEKDRDRRYQSASALGADIRRYLDGRPIDAKRDSGLYVLRKTLLRHRVPVVVGVLFLTLVLASAIVMGVLYRRAEERAEALRRSNYFNRIALAWGSYEDGNTVHMSNLLDECPPDLRGWEWRFLDRLSDTSRVTLHGHTDHTWATYSPDGTMIASGSRDGSVMLWDAETGAEIRTLPGSLFVGFSPDGRLLVTGARQSRAQVWNVSSGEATHELVGHTPGVTAGFFSPDGTLIATCGADGAIKLWDAGSGMLVETLPGHPSPINSAKWSDDGRYIITGDMDGVIRIWDMDARVELGTLEGHTARIQGLAFTPGGDQVVSASWDCTVRLWDVESRPELRVVQRDREPFLCVALDSEARRVAVGLAHKIMISDFETGQLIAVRHGHQGNASSLEFSSDGRELLSGGADGTVRRWDLGEEIPIVLRGHTDFVRHVDLSPDGTRIASVARDGVLVIWDVSTHDVVHRLPHGNVWLVSVAFDPTGALVACGDSTGNVHVWDAAAGTRVTQFEGHSTRVFGLAFSPDGRRLASAAMDGTLLVRDVDDVDVAMAVDTRVAMIMRIAWSPDGRAVAGATGEHGVRIWDAVTGSLVRELDAGEHYVIGVTYSHDGRTIAAACSDWSIRTWDAATAEPIHVLHGHRSMGQSVVFSPDDARLVSGGYDNLIKVWDVATGQLALTVAGHEGGVLGLAFSPDGNWFVSASNDQTVRIWDAGPPR